MGFFFPAHVCSRSDLIDDITEDLFAYRAARRYCCGNVLWVLWSPIEGTEASDFRDTLDPWIGCYLMHRVGGEWGYKPMEEGSGPFYYSCPLAYLEVAPVVDDEWRAMVRAYWSRRAAKRAAKRAATV